MENIKNEGPKKTGKPLIWVALVIAVAFLIWVIILMLDSGPKENGDDFKMPPTRDTAQIDTTDSNMYKTDTTKTDTSHQDTTGM